MKQKVTPGLRGRPRGFDLEEALERALQVFWHKGYEGASLSDLTEAMGINRPSLYAAFGNKEDLFRKVLDRYAAGPASYAGKALGEPTARAAVERLLRDSADLLTNPKNPAGCLMVQGALACGDASHSIQQELNLRRAAGREAIVERLKRAKAEHDLPADADPADLARYVATLAHGMAVQAAGGATRSELHRVIDLALQTWPLGSSAPRAQP